MKKLERIGVSGIDRQKVKLERAERPPKDMQWPKFGAMFDPDAHNPLDDIALTGDAEIDAAAENDTAGWTFLNNNRPDDDPFRVMLDPEFYFVVCFQSRQQKDEFLKLSGLASLGDKYIDGLKVAKHLDIDIPPIPLPMRKPKAIPRLMRDIKIIPKGGDSKSVI